MNIQEALHIYAERIRMQGGEESEEISQMKRCPFCQKITLQVASEVRESDFTELCGVKKYSIHWRCSECGALAFRQGWLEEV